MVADDTNVCMGGAKGVGEKEGGDCDLSKDREVNRLQILPKMDQIIKLLKI